MAAETADIRNKTRRVKAHILNRYLKLADKVDDAELKGKSIKEALVAEDFLLYRELTETFSRNVLPRTTELTGEDGGALVLEISETIAKKNNLNVTNTEPDPDSTGSTPL